MAEKTTAQIANELNKDTTKYNSLELAEATVDSIESQVSICIERGLRDFSDDEFSIVMMNKVAPRLTNVVKRIFYPSPFLPKPAPDQAVWVYNRHTGKLTFMWSLPEPYACVHLSAMYTPPKKYERSAGWCRLYFEDKLIDFIRKETGIKLQTEHECLESHRDELANMLGNSSE